MEQSSVEKVICVDESGQEKELIPCMVISCNGDDFSVDVVGMKPVDMVRSTIGLVEALRKLGLGEALDQMTEYFYGDQKECVADEGLSCNLND